jgi:hypothetical protein
VLSHQALSANVAGVAMRLCLRLTAGAEGDAKTSTATPAALQLLLLAPLVMS